jgi:hypothetical protein
MSSIQAKLQSGVATMTKSKFNFDAKITTSSAPSRPTKRKSEVLELSDSDDDEPAPQPKRRQPVPQSTYSAPPPQKTVKPWDQDHTKKKLPSNAQSSLSGASVVPKTQGKLTADLVSLSKQQSTILDVVMDGKNVFFTGSAGM